MKTLFAFLILVLSLPAHSQVALLRGRVMDVTDRGFIQGAQLKFLKNDTTISSGFMGNYRIGLRKSLTDTIEITHPVYGSTIVTVSLGDKTVKELDIHFPVDCSLVTKTDICPKCKSNKHILNIVYGYPSDELMKDAEKGKVRLGGCVVDNCVPRHYCKTDDLEF